LPLLARRALLRAGAALAAGGVVGPAAWRLARGSAGNGSGAGPGSGATASASVAPPGCAGSVRNGPPAQAGPPRAPLHPDALASFVDPLPVPRVLAPSGRRADPADPSRTIPVYRVEMRAAPVRVHREVPPTTMWTYEGTMPGPTIEARRGEPLLVEWVNALPARHMLPVDTTLHGAGPGVPEVRAVVHVHGARVPPESDGHPEAWVAPGGAILARYPAAQDATTLWYHDHAMGIERLNVYAGLLGCFLVRDDAEGALDLPRGAREVPLVLCDRNFDADGQLRYPVSNDPSAPWVSEVVGDAILVNGALRPYFDAEPARYRLRVVNASNGRTFALAFADGRVFHAIGGDQGLLGAPVALRGVSLAPGERVDLVVDLGDAAGRAVELRTGVVPLLQMRVAAKPRERARTRSLPAVLRRIEPAATVAASAVGTRTLTIDEFHDPVRGRMQMLLDKKYWHDPVSERPVLGTTEVWSLVNTTGDAHPIHLHLARFRVLDRQAFDPDEYAATGTMTLVGPRVPPPPEEAGWKDTVRADPGVVTRIAARFEGFTGTYVWHCHVLEHAANEMMRPMEIVAPG
jgi:spore coat protein A